MVRILLCFYCAALLISSSFSLVEAAQRTDPSEVSALRAIKDSLVDLSKNLQNWMKGDPCVSNWTGILCYAAQDDGYLHIRELQLLKMEFFGSLAPELGNLTKLEILDFMWNNLTGSIPKEIGNIKTLRLLLLNGNQLTGSIPEEIGYLPNLDRLQIDQNQISGPIPKSFANLTKVRHLHMNNNSLSGQIPPELSTLLKLRHLLVDNNNLSGDLPELPEDGDLKILQLDNNNFGGSSIPSSYGKTRSLLKLSLRNCSLQGSIPDLSEIPLLYLDLSWNQLEGRIPSQNLSVNITTIDLSHNLLIGNIPSSFSTLPKLQRLSLQNNILTGSVPSPIWQNSNFTTNETLILDFRNNSLTSMQNDYNPPANVSVLLSGNPICKNASQLTAAGRFCGPTTATSESKSPTNYTTNCGSCPTDKNYEYNPQDRRQHCQCVVPVEVGLRLKSPGISDFPPYIDDFEESLSSFLHLFLDQLYISSYAWQENGRRLNMQLKIFPADDTIVFNVSEIVRLRDVLATWIITLPDIFGPYEFLYFSLGSYKSEFLDISKSTLSTGAIVGIVVGATVGVSTLCVIITIMIMKRRSKGAMVSRRHASSRRPIKVDGVKCFTFEEVALATKDFCDPSFVGEGGYGKVHRGVLTDGTVVAIKRAHEGSMQGTTEFLTEIELLSRLHHRNLVSLVGYCDEMEEQMLVYEYMPNGTLRDHLSGKSKEFMNFSMRLHIALGSARGILYLHTEANPPIFHRDIKASNILLDSKFIAKVADFGLSRLAPVANVEGIIPTHVSTVVKGTPGYLDPEYFLTHNLTDKSDVYSLGVVFLELLSGLPPISHGKNLVREVSMAYRSGETSSIIDRRMGSCPSDCIEKFMSLALGCCNVDPVARPPMSEIVRELETILSMLPDDISGPLYLPVSESDKTRQMLDSPFVSLDLSGNDQSISVISELGSFAPR